MLLFSVEVLDTTQWGKVYEAPVGVNIRLPTQAFEYAGLYFMAHENNTVVTLPNGTILALHQGDGMMVQVNQADTIRANKPIQADLITLDVSSVFEVRWFSLRPFAALSDQYVSPMGDTRGNTKLILYNPNVKPMTMKLQYIVNGTKTQYSQVVAPKQSVFSVVIPSESAAWVDADMKFVALSMTDTEVNCGVGGKPIFKTNGEIFDWGFPLVPRNELTSQVLVGFGYACTDNECSGKQTFMVM